MRIGLTLNSVAQYVASIPAPGYLSAHLNLSEHPEETRRKICIKGYDTSSGTENVSLQWPTVELAVGDVVELHVLEAGEGSPPASIRRSSQNPGNLFSSEELAAEAIGIGLEFQGKIAEFLHKAQDVESAEEAKKIRLALGHILAALGEHLYSPIWRRHPALVPPEMQGKLL